MYLKNVILHNFKCYEEISIDFHKKITVIAGENGAGKTSVLEAIAIGLSTMFQPIEGAKSQGIEKYQARLKPFSIGSSREMQAQFPVEISMEAEIDGQTTHWKRSLNTAKSTTTIKDAKEIINVATAYRERVHNGDTSLTLPILAYYGTGRLWDYHREKQSNIFATNSRFNGYIDSLDGSANVKLMMNWFLKMTIQKYQDQEIGLRNQLPELEAVLSAMEACYKQITGIDECTIQYRMNTNELMLSYKNQNNEFIQLPINQLSDGYKSTISLVADIAYRMAVLNPQLLGDVCTKTHGIVLIDEVDQHLHPSWQQRVLDDLSVIFPNVQFIVTTHAPAVINTVRSVNLVYLYNDHKVDYPSGEVYGKDVNTILSGTMNADERPKKIKVLFEKFHNFLSERDYDEAQRILDYITELIQGNDPDLSACKIKLELRKNKRR